jgi:hypothetical protein
MFHSRYRGTDQEAIAVPFRTLPILLQHPLGGSIRRWLSNPSPIPPPVGKAPLPRSQETPIQRGMPLGAEVGSPVLTTAFVTTRSGRPVSDRDQGTAAGNR